MLKEFAQYLVSLKDNKIYDINGEKYSDNALHRIAPYVPRPEKLNVTGLDSIVKLVKAEMKKVTLPIFIRVDGPTAVTVLTALDNDMNRDVLFHAECDVPGFREGFREYEKAIIEIRSKFAPDGDVDYLLDLLSRINKENGVSTSDNGVSQTVEARTGVSLKQMVNVRPRVTLSPYRTFLEVEQPASEFLLRLNDDGDVGLFEADGGMWKLEAKKYILAYFDDALNDEINAGHVIVMM